jgi:hypothetical protein
VSPAEAKVLQAAIAFKREWADKLRGLTDLEAWKAANAVVDAVREMQRKPRKQRRARA